MTIAQKFFKDPRVLEAKKLIIDSLTEHQKGLNKLKEPESKEAAQKYQETIDKISQNRGGKLFYDYLGSGLGSGPFVELADGSTKYDFITGIGVHFLGHSHPGLMQAVLDGAISNTIMQGNLQQNVDSDALIELFLKEANRYGAQFDHCFLTSSGVMANENALKMIFQKRFPANRVMAFEKCFHGRTISVGQITDKPKNREGVPTSLDVDYIPFYDYTDHEGSIKRTLEAIEKHLQAHPGKHAVFIGEVIQGEAGSWPGNEEFFKTIFQKLRDNNISIVVDEVQTFGRTEKLFAFQYFNLDNHIDMVTIGKMSQVCATLYRKDHSPKPGLISQTFTSSSTAINASYYIVKSIVDGNFLGKNGRINQVHNHFKKRLEELSENYPDKIEGPYGVGGMIVMTLFGGDMEKSKEFTKRFFDKGVLSFIAGSSPTRVRMLIPTGIIEEKHIDEVAAIIEKVLKSF